jgi:predicted ArsR family transcriptional regulator
MERQTRQLLEVLADELTDRLLGELSSGEVLETELQRRLSSSRQTIGRRLAELELWGVLLGEDRQTPGRGRPTRAWRLASPEVAAFLREADGLLLRLLEEKARRHRSALHSVPESDKAKHLRAID